MRPPLLDFWVNVPGTRRIFLFGLIKLVDGFQIVLIDVSDIHAKDVVLIKLLVNQRDLMISW